MLVEQDRNPCVHALVPIGELREEATWTFPPSALSIKPSPLFFILVLCAPLSFLLFVVYNMRFNTALTSALVSSASLMGYAHAEEETADTTVIDRPAFTVCIYNYTLSIPSC